MIEDLLKRHRLISDQVDVSELREILRCLISALEHDGAVVEFGCFSGTTSLFITRILAKSEKQREYHVYDSFEGLPEKQAQDESPAGTQFSTGELAASKADFVREFKKAGLRLPTIHKAWFESLTEADVPGHICFAFLDGDYYSSTLTPLQLIEKRMVSGGYIVIDDYQNEALPGAARAVDEWLRGKPHALRIAQSLAIVKII